MTAIIYWLEPTTNQVKSVNFDVVETEGHAHSLTVTSHPVEEGADVTDHARIEPREITLEGYVSNKPLLSNMYANPLLSKAVWDSMAFSLVDLDLDGGAKAAGLSASTNGAPIYTPGGATAAIKGAVSSLIFGKPPNPRAAVQKFVNAPPDRRVEVYDKLLDAHEGRALVTVITAMGTRDNMLITKIDVPRTTEDGNGARFQITLHQIRIVKSKTVDAPKPAEARAANAQALGSKAAKAKNAAESKGQSLLAAGTDATGLGKFIPKVPGT